MGATMRGYVVLAVAVLLAGVVAPAVAHHSFPVHFVPGKLITVEGVVTEFSFRNPHGLLQAETNSPNILRRRGWTEESIKPGDRVKIEGYPARDGSQFMRVYRVIYADGRELVGQRPDPNAPAED